MPRMLVILPPSAPSQSTVGSGFPRTVQSTRPPFTLVNSTLDGGSVTKLGPCVSYEAPEEPASEKEARYVLTSAKRNGKAA